MSGEVTADLQNYCLHERNRYIKTSIPDSPIAFILNKHGGRMAGDGYWRRLKYLAGKSGLPSWVSLHHLRHSIATHLLESGVSTEQVRDFLGHSFLETTQIYTRVSAEALARVDSPAENI